VLYVALRTRWLFMYDFWSIVSVRMCSRQTAKCCLMRTCRRNKYINGLCAINVHLVDFNKKYTRHGPPHVQSTPPVVTLIPQAHKKSFAVSPPLAVFPSSMYAYVCGCVCVLSLKYEIRHFINFPVILCNNENGTL
jgi:hypothetical protein